MEPPRALSLLKFSNPPAPNVNAPPSPSASGASAPPIGSAYELLTHNFTSVLKQVGDLPFAVICMSGNSRIGKSYTLNYFIRHLSGDQGNSSGSSGEFKWRKGTERETIGINLWSQPFFTNYKGRRIAVLLMDAQGLFDPYTTIQQNSVIFALCSLFSSVGIFNLLKKLHADTLQNVNFFTEYARAIGHKRNTQGHLDDDSEGFQRLVIMVRDFDDDDEYGYGYHDSARAPLNSKGTCKNYFQDTMSIENNAAIPYENKAVIKGIRDNYDSIGIVLHPDPGKKFRQNPTENTPDEEYITKTKEFVALMLSDQYLITKKIDGDELTGTQFIPYVEHLGDICKNAVDTFPPAQTIAESASIMSFNLAFTNAYHIFLETANDFMAANPHVEDAQLQGAYERAIQNALVAFNKIKKIGGKQKEIDVRNNLLAKCQSKFDTLKEAFCLRRDLHHVKIEFELQTKISNQTIIELNLQKVMMEEQKKQSEEAIDRLTSETIILNENRERSAAKMKDLEELQKNGEKMQKQTREEAERFRRELEETKKETEKQKRLSEEAAKVLNQEKARMDEANRRHSEAIAKLSQETKSLNEINAKSEAKLNAMKREQEEHRSNLQREEFIDPITGLVTAIARVFLGRILGPGGLRR